MAPPVSLEVWLEHQDYYAYDRLQQYTVDGLFDINDADHFTKDIRKNFGDDKSNFDVARGMYDFFKDNCSDIRVAPGVYRRIIRVIKPVYNVKELSQACPEESRLVKKNLADSEHIRSQFAEQQDIWGTSLREIGRSSLAFFAFERAIEIDPHNMQSYKAIAFILMDNGENDLAIQYLRSALAVQSDYAEAWYMLAYIYRKGKKDYAASVDAYHAYIKLRPDDPDPYYGLGKAYKEMGEIGKAREVFNQYIRMEKRPGHRRWVDRAIMELRALPESF